MRKVLWCVDQVAVWGGRITSWLSLLIALAVIYEVFMRYILHLPTVWASELVTVTSTSSVVPPVEGDSTTISVFSTETIAA